MGLPGRRAPSISRRLNHKHHSPLLKVCPLGGGAPAGGMSPPSRLFTPCCPSPPPPSSRHTIVGRFGASQRGTRPPRPPGHHTPPAAKPKRPVPPHPCPHTRAPTPRACQGAREGVYEDKDEATGAKKEVFLSLKYSFPKVPSARLEVSPPSPIQARQPPLFLPQGAARPPGSPSIASYPGTSTPLLHFVPKGYKPVFLTKREEEKQKKQVRPPASPSKRRESRLAN